MNNIDDRIKRLEKTVVSQDFIKNILRVLVSPREDMSFPVSRIWADDQEWRREGDETSEAFTQRTFDGYRTLFGKSGVVLLCGERARHDIYSAVKGEICHGA